MKDVLVLASRINCDVEFVRNELIVRNGEEVLDVSFKLINKDNLPIETELFKKELFATGYVLNIETPNLHKGY
jgi:hypothetical protein